MTFKNQGGNNTQVLKHILVNAELVDRNIAAEMEETVLKYGAFNSWHEGYAFLLEEVNELWDKIKTYEHDSNEIFNESIQVAAMARKIALYAYLLIGD